MRSGLSRKDVEGKMKEIVHVLFDHVPSGVGRHRRDLKLSNQELKKLLRDGARWPVEHGFGVSTDLERIEENGTIPWADPDMISDRALERGRGQCGTLGSGNHFAEIDYVSEIYDEEIANALGLFKDQITVIIHTGSRGLGHQTCDDYIKVMINASKKYGIELPDLQLCAAPISSPEGKKYIGAMGAAANFAFANRQIISHWVRETLAEVLKIDQKTLNMQTVYDVCHNIGKIETFEIDGKKKQLFVHRKGATRAFPPGHPATPEVYRAVGQPVLIPGDMGRYSYVLVGTEKAYQETFGSTCHGAGRRMSRTQAKKVSKGRPIVRQLEDQGIYVRSAGMATLMEEIPEAYKDVSDVVNVVHNAGISKKVAQVKPIGVIKG